MTIKLEGRHPIAKRRIKLGLTIFDMGKLCETSHGVIGRIEAKNGDYTISDDLMNRLSDALNVKRQELEYEVKIYDKLRSK